ncbi:aminopeptidase [Pseudoflavitalea sp. X16]|uniref:M1 family metallopeptidase n=1 Tax=Paraflavitalea devenefica TaxID=2716334 RepID=UPI00141F8DFA|nr:M1 family aminopeptidase [Paraflavitalea devenefica]NII29538.1 aminopeptidase [Paraflavitalea devenefica]
MSLTRLLLISCFIVLMGVSCKEAPEPAPAPGVPLTLAGQRKALLSGIRYQLDFTLPAQKDQPVTGLETVFFTLSSDTVDVVLDFKQAPGSVRSLKVNGHQKDVRHENEHIIIPAGSLKKGENKAELLFEAGNSALNRNPDYMYALFVPERARTAFPCFDQPDLKAIFELSITIPQAWKAMSNGPLVKTTPQDSSTAWQFGPSDTIPTYLFSFTAGRFNTATKMAGGREMEFLYRETDSVKLASSIPAIFDMHAQSLQFLEGYTGIPYPFRKFSFAAIPDFQFGGMEHPGAIWYNANSLFLDSSATRTQLIRRATLIAHETSHMWFGDLVTMKWFNDVWMKEVFANFMADKIAGVMLPDNNAGLKFMIDHYPAAYSVDRTRGANPIRQPLDNLDEAGSLYGNIIYHKAPIMMLQLERLIGSPALQKGLQEYLRKYAFNNATWPDLITILDSHTTEDLQSWNDSWVNRPGRPAINQFLTDVKGNTYGLFNIDTTTTGTIWQIKDPVLRAFNYVNLYENVIEGRDVTPENWMLVILKDLSIEKEELISQLLLNELNNIYWVYLSPAKRSELQVIVEAQLLKMMNNAGKPNMKKQFFKAWTGIAASEAARNSMYNTWNHKQPPAGVKLTEDDYTDLAAGLALRNHPAAGEILKEQLARTENPDKKARLEFLMPSLAADEKVRGSFFESLKDVKNRRKEAWVNTAVAYLHHPLRGNGAEQYIMPSLDLLEDIQRTGDIFFPYNWLQATLGMYQSERAAATVSAFISTHPGYNSRLLNKLLQTADHLFRARKILDNKK